MPRLAALKRKVLLKLPDEVDKQLQSFRYVNLARTRDDIKQVLISFEGDFTPTTPKVPLEDGTIINFVFLDGKIVAEYNGNSYIVPVYIWILGTYPVEAPVCFIYPTVNMSVVVSPYVAENGRISLPYLEEWTHGRSDLVGLIKAMKASFDAMLPVYTTSRQTMQLLPQLASNPTFGGLRLAASNCETDGPSPGSQASKNTRVSAIDTFMSERKLKHTDTKKDSAEKKN